MCGIAGFSRPGPDAPDILSRMLAALAHRGPDAACTYLDRHLALAHRRLAVVDPQGGAQPRIDEATGDALVFNGEIYGFSRLADELRQAGVALRDRSDTEVLFQLLRHRGVAQTLSCIDGMFAFAYRNGADGTLYLARDRFGEKPLYYAVSNAGLIFGSEASAILCHPARLGAAPDPRAGFALLQFEYLPGDLSGWQGISKLPAASLLRFADGRASVERYWSPPLPQSEGESETQTDDATAIDTLDSLLQDAVRQQLVADVPVGIFLSGGLDSSLLAAIAARQAPNIIALTVQAGTGNFDETPHAVTVARHLGLRHDIVALSEADLHAALDGLTAHLTEPLADSSLLPTYLVCQAARARMTVALGGDGADELFAGYPNFQVQRLAGLMARCPSGAAAALHTALDMLPPGNGYMSLRFRLRQLAQGLGHKPARQSFLWMAPFSGSRLRALWAPGVLPEGIWDESFASIDAAGEEARGAGGLDRLLHQFLLTYLPDDILMKTDRAAMFNSLEVRAPFLHRPLAAYAAALPVTLKHRRGVSKHILKQVARRYLPDAIIDRRKHGFAVPIGPLLRGIFRDRVRDTLLSRDNPVSHWFDRQQIETLLSAHLSGRRDHGKPLWALFMLFNTAAWQPPPHESTAP
jgi:asparagine synthase (glutamine-hydrolysing)